MNIFKYKNSKSSHGYTLLFSVLTATIVLSVAVFILGVSRKQLALAIAARDSMYSLYAADSGIECAAAAYKNKDLATSTSADPNTLIPAKINCAGEPYASTGWTINTSWSGWDKVYVSSAMNIDLDDGTCAKVVIYNGYIQGKNVVDIDSSGYNYCYPKDVALPNIKFTPQKSNRTVERALVLTYE